MNTTVERMQQELQAARKNRDQIAVETLQAVLTRITNAEAVSPGAENISAEGVGTTEMPRKVLSAEEVRALIREELNELEEARASMAAYPEHTYTAELAQKIAILSHYTAV